MAEQPVDPVPAGFRLTAQVRCEIMMRLIRIVFYNDQRRAQYFDSGKARTKAELDSGQTGINTTFWRTVTAEFNDEFYTIFDESTFALCGVCLWY